MLPYSHVYRGNTNDLDRSSPSAANDKASCAIKALDRIGSSMKNKANASWTANIG